MATKEQKQKIAAILKRLGTVSEEDFTVFDSLLKEIKKIEDKIPKVPDIFPLEKDVSALKDKTDRLSVQLQDSIKKALKDIESSHTSKEDFNKEIENIRDLITDIKKTYVERLKLFQGGGNMNRQIQVNGVDVLKRYTDINFKGNVSASTNNTTHMVDISFSSIAVNLVVGELVSFSGTTGTIANTPILNSVALYRGGARQQAGAGNDYTISGATITLASPASVGEVFLADYQF